MGAVEVGNGGGRGRKLGWWEREVELEFAGSNKKMYLCELLGHTFGGAVNSA